MSACSIILGCMPKKLRDSEKTAYCSLTVKYFLTKIKNTYDVTASAAYNYLL